MPKHPEDRISSEGMDKKIEKKTWTTKRIAMVAGGVAIVALFVYSFIFMDVRSTLNVDKEKLTISTVREGTFQDFVQVTGTVQPIQTVEISPNVSGNVEEIFLESGTMVEQGDTILTMSNSDLQLRVMNQTSGIYDQINQTRNSRLNIEQNTLSLKERLASARQQLTITRSNFQRQKQLYEKDLIAEQDFIEAKENYQYQNERYNLIYESFRQDSIKAERQLEQIDQSLDRMFRSLEAVQGILNRLIITAPIAGQLATIEMNPGQSISLGEKIGQIDILDNFKIRVGIDEFHLSRITRGLNGSFDFAGRTHELVITKVFPVVENGQFEVDMEFVDEPSSDLTRGQTVRIRLELGQSSTALLLPRGGFFNTTGGNWVYKLNEDGDQAVRHDIRIGQQNPEYFEVLSGLEPGDQVITSSYDTFGDNEVLNLQ